MGRLRRAVAGNALAEACEVAELDAHQRLAVMLAAAGLGIREIGFVLELPRRRRRRRAGKEPAGSPAQQILMSACERLAGTHESLIAGEMRRIRAMIHCQRNRQPAADGPVGNPNAPVAIYAKVPGGWDPVPVNVRARPFGERPEDHLDDPYDFLRAFERLANRA